MATQNSETKHELNNSENSEFPTNIVINIDNEENSNNNETETKTSESGNNNLDNGHNNTKHNNLETENKNIKNENSNLQTENKNMNNENGIFETEHADGKHENKDIHIENSNLQTDHGTTKNENTTSNSKHDNLNENSKIKNEDSTIRNENGNVNNENNIMRKQNGSFYPENGAAKLQISELLTVQLPTRTRMSFMEEESAKEKLRLALLKQCAAILKQGDQRYTKESLHKTFQDVDLLERIYRLFDTDNKEYLVQDDWFEFLKQRLTDEKQIDLVEQLESVAYVLCGNDVINLDAFQLILQNKVVTNKLFRVLDIDGDGYTTADEVMEFISTVSSSRPRVGFDKASVDRLEELFKKTVGDQKEITKEQFRKIMESKNPYFTERVFQIFDEDNNGTISLQEFITAVHQFAGNSPQDKIRFLFKVYDMDNDGLIQHRELQHVMKVCMEENGMLFSESQLLELTGAMFEDADLEKRGAITYEAFIRMLDGHGGLMENITTSIDRWLVPPNNNTEPTSFIQKLRRLKPYQLSLPYIRNNYVLLGYLAAFFIVNLVLFVTRCVEYRESNGFVIVARGCGQCLNFNCAWVLVLMLRHCITTMRVRGLGAMLPLDHHIYLHKLTGMLIAFYSALHTAMHLSNFSVIVVNDPEVNSANYTLNQWLFTSEPGLFGLVGGWANPTGFVLLFLLAVMFVCSQSFVRRRGSFKIFYWTHLLYIPFWVALILHAPNFYKWFIVPGAIYFIERVLRYVWMMSERSKTYISSGILLPSRVTHLVIKRPSHFDFHAGDYVFVNIPAIAMYEWHPFTISSAPELEGYIWLHVRGVGEWTNRLYAYFEKEQARLQAPAVPALENGHEKLARSSSGQSTRSIISKGLGSFRKKKKVSLEVPIESHLEHVTTEFDLNLSPISKKSQVLSPQRLLEKSISMPDVQKKAKKLALRDFLRSESMIDHLQVSSEMQELSSYKSPAHHKDLEHRFRYMRTKPPIIAFKTPSFEECERRRSNESIITLARRRLSKTISPDKDVETPTEKDVDNNCIELQESAANLPVGKPLELYIDGPYGAASSHIFQSQHAALIAAGIGVTPFASILQSIMYKYWQARQTCVKCGHCWTDSLPSYNMRLRKVDFFWINREQRSFEWFVSLLSQLEMEQAEQRLPEGERFLEMHMYITSALQRNDMKAVGLQLALDLLHEKEKRDLITGLKTRTNAGRPNWDKVFKQLQDQNKGKVTVFYCGPPQLARTLKIKCSQYGFNFRKEVF